MKIKELIRIRNQAHNLTPTPTQVLYGGLTFLHHLFLEDLIVLDLVSPIKLEEPVILSLMVFRIMLEVNLKLGVISILGATSSWRP
jgi:hypothetical protein